MIFPIAQICCVGRHRVHIPMECNLVAIWPNEHEKHVSYGHVLMSTWINLRNEHGLLWLEGDIAITPEHLDEIEQAQRCYPDYVIAVPYLLYPKTTQKLRPMWSNQGQSPQGAPVPYDVMATPPSYPGFFSLGCTYLPKRLLDLVDLSRGNWDYPCLDTRLSELALDKGIMCISTQSKALHLHY